MMAGLSVRSVLRVMIPAAAVALLIGVVLTGYLRELDRLLGSGPENPAASDLPSILTSVADSLSTSELAGLLAEQFVPRRTSNPADVLKRSGFALLLSLKYKKESLLAFFFDRTPFAFPRKTPVRGFERAARAYFGVSPDRLTTGEAILLFHLARFPDAPLPVNDPEQALVIRDRLLLDLLNDKLITPAQYRSESSRPLILSGRHPAAW